MYKIILHPTDLLENHYALCEQAAKLAAYFHADLYLLHVIQPPAALQIAQGLGFAEIAEPAREDALSVINLLCDPLSIPKKNAFVQIGSIKHAILEKAQELHADLIIIGSHSTTQFSPFLGSTAYSTLNHAPCDVLTINPKKN